MDKSEAAFEKLVEAFTDLAEAQKAYNDYVTGRGHYDDGYGGQRYYDTYQDAAKRARLVLNTYILSVVAQAMQQDKS